jgi:hydroxymethylglutaryl-CoA synthase
MSASRPIGISDIGLYLPSPTIDVDTVVARRVLEDPRMGRHFERALRVTGQRAMRFPEPWEDSATMAAQAAHDLLSLDPRMDLGRLRHLAVGTETGTDHSKPLSAPVQGMLQRSGLPIPTALSSFQSQHACAGGTMAMLSVAGLMVAGGNERDSALVINSDIARYETGSTAEITQGAGAVALRLESSPDLVEIDLASLGFSSRDVDDFYRPLGATTARVKGTFSMQCYAQSLEDAFLDHCDRAGVQPEQELGDTDFFALHTPFRNMPQAALGNLLERHLGLTAEQSAAVLAERGFGAAVDPIARIGNLYTGSLYAVLAFLLADRYRVLGSAIRGKRILFASYGSGNTMIVFSGRISTGAPSVVERWNHATARGAGFGEYESWIAGANGTGPRAFPAPRSGAFFLAGIRADGYREYTRAAGAEVEAAAHAGSVDIMQPIAV